VIPTEKACITVRVSSAMFTFCLFIFWLHTVVLRKTRKLQYTNRVNLSVFTVHQLWRLYRHIFTVFYPFHKINSSRHNTLWILKLGITMLIHNKDDIQFVTEFPWYFLGHPVTPKNVLFLCILMVNKKQFQGGGAKNSRGGKLYLPPPNKCLIRSWCHPCLLPFPVG